MRATDCMAGYIPNHSFIANSLYTEGKGLATNYNGFSHKRSFLLAGVQTCKLFENDLITTKGNKFRFNTDDLIC